MLQGHVLAVLGAIGSAAPEAVRDARVAAYRRVPAVLRGAVRARVTRAVSSAMFATQHGADEAHVHRLAYLDVVGRSVGSDDVAEVRAAFERTRAARPEREHPSTMGTVLMAGMVLLGPAVVLLWWLWSFDPYATLSATLPASGGAYVEGGRPLPGTAEQRALFAERVPAFVVALDRWRAVRGRPEEAEARAAVEREQEETMRAAREALSADTVSFLDAVLAQSIAAVGADASIGRHAAASHVRSVDALDAALAAEGLGYYVDAEVVADRATGRNRVYLSTFTVENVAIYEAEGRVVRALWLRRLDDLAFSRAVLGFTRPQVRDALVLVDRVEEHLVRTILPALAPDGTLALTGDAAARFAPVGAHVAAGLREDAAGWAFGDAAGVAELGSLFAQRRALFATWAERLSARGLVLREPSGYVLDTRPYAAFAGVLAPGERRELDRLAAALAEARHQRTYRVIESLFLVSIQRHEVQHRLDFAMGTLDATPARLEALLGPLHRDGAFDTGVRRANAELSAYLSELARDTMLLRANLALLLGYVLDEQGWDRAESYAAIVVLDGLAEHLGIAHEPLVVRYRVDREEAARVHAAITARPSQEVRGAAEALWRELYGRRLPALQTGGRAPIER